MFTIASWCYAIRYTARCFSFYGKLQVKMQGLLGSECPCVFLVGINQEILMSGGYHVIYQIYQISWRKIIETAIVVKVNAIWNDNLWSNERKEKNVGHKYQTSMLKRNSILIGRTTITGREKEKREIKSLTGTKCANKKKPTQKFKRDTSRKKRISRD